MKARVIFKNVGQGDTIIIETESNGCYHIGIIDCKKYHRKNVVIEYLESLKERGKKYVIEFIVLSHIHKDHYSGLEGLFEFIKKDGHRIIRFYSTYYWLSNLINSANANSKIFLPADFESDLKKMREIILQAEKTTIDDFYNIELSAEIPIIKMGLFIKPLSPSNHEYDIFRKAIDSLVKKERASRTSNYANLFSTILMINRQDDSGKFLMLTADAIKGTFARLADVELDKTSFKNQYRKMLAGQLPHHGSYNNFHTKFWEKVKQNLPSIPVIVSVGSNPHGHPNEKVKIQLRSMGYKIYLTSNRVSFFTKLEDQKLDANHYNTTSHSLDYISFHPYRKGNDISIEL